MRKTRAIREEKRARTIIILLSISVPLLVFSLPAMVALGESGCLPMLESESVYPESENLGNVTDIRIIITPTMDFPDTKYIIRTDRDNIFVIDADVTWPSSDHVDYAVPRDSLGNVIPPKLGQPIFKNHYNMRTGKRWCYSW